MAEAKPSVSSPTCRKSTLSLHYAPPSAGDKIAGMRIGTQIAKLIASILLAGTLAAGLAGACFAEAGDRPPARNATPPNAVRTKRLHVPSDFFEQGAVRFERAQIDASGVIRADGHNLEFYGVVLVRRTRICTAPEGARWACGQHAFVALRRLLEGQPVICNFKHATVPPKAVCLIRDSDIAQFLLSEGWAELADGVTDEAYVEAQETAQNRKVGIWADGPP
jgi:endonuclease YncB( thermonuclease family)